MFDKDIVRQLNKTRFPKVLKQHQVSLSSIKKGRNTLMNLSVDISPLDKSMESVKNGKRNLLAASFDLLNHSVDSKDIKKKTVFPLMSPRSGLMDLNASFDGKRSLPT